MWSMGTVLVKGDDFSGLDDAGTHALGSTATDEADAAMKETKKAIRALIKSGALGKGPFRITANGHSNKGNKDDGSGPDHIGINIVFDDMAEVPTPEQVAASRGEVLPDGTPPQVVDNPPDEG
jgi:hypothetical protein